MSLKNPRGFTVQEIFWKHGNFLDRKVRFKNFWDTYYEYYLLKEKPRPFASEILRRLHEEGYVIYLICTRTFVKCSLEKEYIKHLTKLWLLEYGIYFDFLIFSDMINMELIKKYYFYEKLDFILQKEMGILT